MMGFRPSRVPVDTLHPAARPGVDEVAPDQRFNLSRRRKQTITDMIEPYEGLAILKNQPFQCS